MRTKAPSVVVFVALVWLSQGEPAWAETTSPQGDAPGSVQDVYVSPLDSGPIEEGCECDTVHEDQTGAPVEGFILLPDHTCFGDSSRSILVTDASDAAVAGDFDFLQGHLTQHTVSGWQADDQTHHSYFDFSYSLGLKMGLNAKVIDVLWDGPAFKAGIVKGMEVLSVGEVTYSHAAMQDAIDMCAEEGDVWSWW